MVTINVSAADLARGYLTDGRKTGAARVGEIGITSQGRPVRWIELGKNGKINLIGRLASGFNWSQSYRGRAPIDD